MSRVSGATVSQGTYGHWWSAGLSATPYARALGIHGNYTYPENESYKTTGFSVRCGDQGSATANNTLHKFPFSLPYSGCVGRGSGATATQGTDGYWWGAGLGTTPYARRLGISGNYTNPENEDYKTYGFSVRCVNREEDLKAGDLYLLFMLCPY